MSGITLSGGPSPGAGTGAVELTETSSRALKLQTDAPHLVSMGGGRLSTAVTLHPIPQGRVTLGSGPGADIPVQGTGVLPLHCHIENSEGVVTIYPLSDNLSIDGVQISGATRLSQGVMLTIGRSNYMRFNHPAEAKLMKSVLPNPRISMAPISFDVDGKTPKKPPVAPRRSPHDSLSDSSSEEPPSSIMTKVSKFEYLAAQNFKKSISPKLFSANVVTVNTPARDVLGKAPPDLQSFTKNMPQSALNYSDSGLTDKTNLKTPERQLFGRKSPQYVNVTINEMKNINNRVIIYENGCVSKNQNYMNVNLDHNDLNNVPKVSSCGKNINVSRVTVPSPGYNRNPAPYYRKASPSPVGKVNFGAEKTTGSLEDLAQRNTEAELRRNKAQADRIKEQEIEKAEQARLEEILTMCAEYEKQAQYEKHNKITPNRIKTNGSLPRDKRSPQSPYGSLSSFTPPQSPRDAAEQPQQEHSKGRNHSYENISVNTNKSASLPRERIRFHYENVEVSSPEVRSPGSGSPYENVVLQPNGPYVYPQSPRTRIKTFVSNKDSSPKDAAELVDNKFAVLEAEKYLLENLNSVKEIPLVNRDTDDSRKDTPTKFILPLEDAAEDKDLKNASQEIEDLLQITQDAVDSMKLAENRNDGDKNVSEEVSVKPAPRVNTLQKQRLEKLKKAKQEKLTSIAKVKRQLAEIETQGEELFNEFELEKALIIGEHKSKKADLEKMDLRKQRLMKRAQKIEASMHDCQLKQERDQEECTNKLELAQKNLKEIEEKLAKTEKETKEYDDVFEDYLNAQEVLDNERKIFEDLEFHHLEEEADWLASREELQREIVDLSQRIEHVRNQISDLEQQKVDTTETNAFELKNIERQRMECLIKLEEVRNAMKLIDAELSMFGSQDSEPEVSSDSDSSVKYRENEYVRSPMVNMSCSMIVSSDTAKEDYGLMSQSFNEGLLDEKAVLDGGFGRKFPSQDDIDRISKVTSSAPLEIDEQNGSLGRKTIESLKEIERQRHLHLCQQGSQVIEQERQKMLALKQKVQQEVRNTWAQRKQDSLAASACEGNCETSTAAKEEVEPEAKAETGLLKPELHTRAESESPESPRPLSETSEISVEVGGTLGRRRTRQIPDKHRPLTRYLPIRGSDLDLRQHIESAGHQVVLCPHVIINSSSCRGFLHKKGSKLNGWSRRWFVFDRNKHTFVYYSDKTEKKPRGGSYFQAIEEVYLDHLNSVKSPNTNLTFIVKTHERFYYLMAPSPEAMRIWVDVIFTGAEGYQEFEHGT